MIRCVRRYRQLLVNMNFWKNISVFVLGMFFLFSFSETVNATVCSDTYTKYQVGCFNKAICNQNSGPYLQSVWDKEKIGDNPNGQLFIGGACSIPGKPDSVCCFAGNSIPDISDGEKKNVLCPLVKNNGFEVACLEFPSQIGGNDFKKAVPKEVDGSCSVNSTVSPGGCGVNDCWKVTASFSCQVVDGILTCETKNTCSDFCAAAPTTPDPKIKCEQKAACVYKNNKCEMRPEAAPVEKKPIDPKVAAENAEINKQKTEYQDKASATFNQIGTTDPAKILGILIRGLIGILGSISLVMFIYGGVLWMTAAGDSGKAEKAREIVLWTSLGLAVIFAAYAIVDFIFEAFR